MSPVPNPFDPRLRNDLSANETTLLHFMSDCMHGHDMSLVDRYVAEDYIPRFRTCSASGRSATPEAAGACCQVVYSRTTRPRC